MREPFIIWLISDSHNYEIKIFDNIKELDRAIEDKAERPRKWYIPLNCTDWPYVNRKKMKWYSSLDG